MSERGCRSGRASPPPIPLKKQPHRLSRPFREFVRRERAAQAEGAALRDGEDHVDEVLGGESAVVAYVVRCGRAVRRRGTAVMLQQSGDALDALGRAQLVDDARQFRKALRLRDDHAVQRERVRG